MQAVQTAAPDGILVSLPLGHRVQVLAAYMEGRKRRASHFVQAKAPVPSLAAPPAELVNCPAGQTMQDFWPVRFEYIAGSHGRHRAEFGAGLYLPRGHAEHCEAPVAFRPVSQPAGQLRHLLSVASAGLKVPTAHFTQAVAPAPLTLTVIWPGGQLVQPALAVWLEYEPAGQVLQVYEPVPLANVPGPLHRRQPRWQHQHQGWQHQNYVWEATSNHVMR
jgi:hypothetical protein